MPLFDTPAAEPDWPATLHRCGLEPSAEERREVEYFDTYDWRLWKRGWTLAVETDEEGRYLVLRDLEDQGIARAHVGTSPAVAADLPKGPRWKQVRRAIEMRALLPLVRCHHHADIWELRDSLGKTTARVGLEVDSLAGRSLPGFVRIEPIRGYEGDAEMLEGLLRKEHRLAPSKEALVERVLRAHGRSPGDTWQVLPHPEPELAAAIAIKRTLACYFETMKRNEPGVLGDIDTEFLHDFRVALRRSRALLNRFRKVLPEGDARFSDELRWLGNVTSPMRDLDVYLLEFDGYEKLVTAASHSALQPLYGYLNVQRGDSLRTVAQTLRSERYRSFAHAWRGYLEDEANVEESPSAREPIVRVAQKRIWSTYRRTMSEGAAIDEASPAVALHDLRKTCKKLRYLLESFGSLFEADAVGELMRGLKRLQNVLGTFQDLEVHAHGLRGFGLAMAKESRIGPESLMAIGELMGRMEDERRRTRERFAETFGEFSSRSVRAAARSQFRPRKKKA